MLRSLGRDVAEAAVLDGDEVDAPQDRARAGVAGRRTHRAPRREQRLLPPLRPQATCAEGGLEKVVAQMATAKPPSKGALRQGLIPKAR